MVEVRHAREEDIPMLVAFGAALLEESPRYQHLPYNAEMVAERIGVLINHEDGAALVAVRGGIMLGVILGFVTWHWFSPTKIASDLSFYVSPEYRGGRAALLLLRAFEEWAKSKGAVDLVPGVSTSVNIEGTASLYERLGYVRNGLQFYKRIA